MKHGLHVLSIRFKEEWEFAVAVGETPTISIWDGGKIKKNR
jgi:hypothetical protein